ncbi:RidA family protein [bacterium AH-315-F03]|nr:RidA family protein [bacterium AH-315-F03]
MKRESISSGAPWESIVGYSRAVKVGNQIFVTGTIAIGENGEIVGVGDPAAQTRRALEIIGTALQSLGASYADVVRTRMFVTDISQWEQIGKAHGEVFAEIRPATTMVEVSKLIAPDALVEIEADAILCD